MTTQYLTQWTSFFADMFDLVTKTGIENASLIDFLLRVWMAIDEECVNLAIPRSKKAAARGQLIVTYRRIMFRKMK